MAIEFGEVISKFVPRSKREMLSPPAQSSGPSVFFGHERLFDYYGIPLDTLNPSPGSKITTLETRDGDLRIYWGERTIAAPLNYYFSQKPS